MGWGDKGWIKKWRKDTLCKSVSAVKTDRWKGVRYSKTFKGNILRNRRAIAEYQGQESEILEKGCKRENARAVLSQVSEWDLWHPEEEMRLTWENILQTQTEGHPHNNSSKYQCHKSQEKSEESPHTGRD